MDKYLFKRRRQSHNHHSNRMHRLLKQLLATHPVTRTLNCHVEAKNAEISQTSQQRSNWTGLLGKLQSFQGQISSTSSVQQKTNARFVQQKAWLTSALLHWKRCQQKHYNYKQNTTWLLKSASVLVNRKKKHQYMYQKIWNDPIIMYYSIRYDTKLFHAPISLTLLVYKPFY